MKNINSWQDIEWDILEDQIFHLQLRIFKAAENRELSKVHKLQTCLISSHFAKYLSLRKIMFDNTCKKIPGIENFVILSPVERFTLSNYLLINDISSGTQQSYKIYPDGKRRILNLSTIEDRAKQMLVYLALYPQWEAQFKLSNCGLRLERSVHKTLKTIFLGVSERPKSILKTDISEYLEQINHLYLIEKCGTFPEMQKQIKIWLKLGILNIRKSISPSLNISQRGILSILLLNITLYDLDNNIAMYIKTLTNDRQSNLRSLIYVRYNSNFIIMYTDDNILKILERITKQSFKSMGLKSYPIKTRIVQSQRQIGRPILEFTFLGFDIIQKLRSTKQQPNFQKKRVRQGFSILIHPCKTEVQKHKLRIREIIQKYRGTTQKKLIQHLNSLIQEWTLARKTQTTNKIFQNLDQYLFIHLWKWARKRHSKMSKFKLRNKYWYKIKTKPWVFGIKLSVNILFELQSHSKTSLQRCIKMKSKTSPFSGNLIYWRKRICKYILIPSTKIQLIKKQKGRCLSCGRFFRSGDVIGSENIILNSFKNQKNYKNKVQIIHNYCHLKKTKKKMLETHRNIKLK
jgi:RNA-directed DNA polymerase